MIYKLVFKSSSGMKSLSELSELEPQAVAVSPYGWLMTHYGWLAGLKPASRGFYGGGGVSYGGLRRIGD